MLSVVTLISGSGSNLQALLKACDNPLYPAKMLAVGSDNVATGLMHAEQHGIPNFVVEPQRFDSKQAWAEVLASNIRHLNPDLIVLAGFMKILPESFVSEFYPRVINLHPSLLPKFPGAHAVRDALAAGEQVTGCTLHVVDALVDSGPIIDSRSVSIESGESEASLHEKIKTEEKKMLTDAVRAIAENRINLEEIGGNG
ncbi:MAG: phosphoribosylglycinamide formyltransferase [Microbacteriaceae bacterium]|nr:phosphoribosylglycinamide formyltransferase [Microbacteriaceae bacterium]MDR9444112.1 phosphoribosylglycinamide formyltransferase [Microbacteriaceae bacterium]